MNKPALLMIPSLEETINRHIYLKECVEMMIQEGYEPLLPPFYDSVPMNEDSFYNRMLPMVDALFMFINFGVDQKMLDMIDRTLNTKEIHYRRVEECLATKVYSTPMQILIEVCMKTNMSIDQMRSKTRKRGIVDARFVYFRRARERTKASLAMIGREVNRDHASVLHGVTEAHNTIQVVELYNKCYGQTEIETTALEPEATGKNHTAQICKPVLPYRSMDPREQSVPAGKPFMRSLSGRGYHQPFGGYRPHNSQGDM